MNMKIKHCRGVILSWKGKARESNGADSMLKGMDDKASAWREEISTARLTEETKLELRKIID